MLLLAAVLTRPLAAAGCGGERRDEDRARKHLLLRDRLRDRTSALSARPAKLSTAGFLAKLG